MTVEGWLLVGVVRQLSHVVLLFAIVVEVK